MPATTCPDRDQLASFVLGTLGEQDAERVGDHLSACAVCAATVDTLDGLEDSVIAGLRESGSGLRFEDEPEFAEALGNLRGIGPGFLWANISVPDACDLPERLGEFQVLGPLGKGGMGAVYRARHLRLGKTVAIKVLPADRVQDSEAKARFDREMMAVGQLEHVNIVRAYDGREIDGQTVLVMEYVEGTDLTTLVARLGRLPIPEACELTRQAAVGLQFIHEHGLVHRDIKPSNLMLARRADSPEPILKILDLGLARLYSDGEVAGDLTSEGRAMGTADYISPEQALNSHDVDIRSDLYSLGCTLYKLLAGHAPFDIPGCRLSAQKLAAHLRDLPTPIRKLRPDVPEGLAAILDRLLAKIAADRYDFPEDLAEAIRPFAAGADLAALARQTTLKAAANANPAVRGARADASTDSFVKSAVSGTDAGPVVEARLPVAAGRLVESVHEPKGHTGTEAPPRPSVNAKGRPGKTYTAGRASAIRAAFSRFWHDPTKPRWLKLATAAPLPLAVFLGVIIVLHSRDGRKTQIEVDDGSVVRASGNIIEVTPPEAPGTGTPTPEVKLPDVITPVKSDLVVTTLPVDSLKVDEPLSVVWQTELKRPYRQEICRAKLTPDGKQVVVFHFTASPRCPIEWIDADSGRLLLERSPTFRAPHLMTVDGWVGREGNLYVMSSIGRTLWKLTPDVNQTLWACPGGGPSFETVQSVLTDASDCVYATGYCGSTGGAGSRAMKLDPSGSLVWEKDDRFGGGTDCYPELALDSQGNLFRAGRDQTDPEDSRKDRGRIIGYRSADGAEILNTTVEESNSRVSGLAFDAHDNLYVAYMHDVYAGPHEGWHQQRAVVQRRDLEGKVLWTYRFPEPGTCFGRSAIRPFGDDALLVLYQKWSSDIPSTGLALLALDDGKLRWTAGVDLPGWDATRGVIDVQTPCIYIGLTNTTDSGLTRVVCLKMSTVPEKED